MKSFTPTASGSSDKHYFTTRVRDLRTSHDLLADAPERLRFAVASMNLQSHMRAVDQPACDSKKWSPDKAGLDGSTATVNGRPLA
jgi:hypothetical protein